MDGHGGGVIVVAGGREGLVGKREDKAAVGDLVPVEQLLPHHDLGHGVPLRFLEGLDAEHV